MATIRFPFLQYIILVSTSARFLSDRNQWKRKIHFRCGSKERDWVEQRGIINYLRFVGNATSQNMKVASNIQITSLVASKDSEGTELALVNISDEITAKILHIDYNVSKRKVFQKQENFNTLQVFR